MSLCGILLTCRPCHLHPIHGFSAHAVTVTRVESSASMASDSQLFPRRSRLLLTTHACSSLQCSAHSAMITGIESTGPLVISGSTDRTVSIWDLR